MSTGVGDPGLDHRPTPDPTVLTTEALARAIDATEDTFEAKLDVLRERLRGIDLATVVLNETVTRTPTEIQKEVGHLRETTDVKFGSVALQFTERDTRAERESRDNKVAVDAAFAAQKDAVSEQNKSNTLAIDKSERTTTETINKNAELARTTTDALSDKIDDLKVTLAEVNRRLDLMQGSRTAIGEQRVDARADSAHVLSYMVAGISLLAVIVTIVVAALAHA